MLGRITASLFFVLLIWGSLVAGMKAGLACPDWPLCQGRLLPPWQLNVWMEFAHRLLAAVAATLLVALSGRRWKSYRGTQRMVPLAAVVLLIGQIAIGGLVVLMGLPLQLTTVHFMLALTVFVLVLYMARCDGVRHPAAFAASGYAGLLLCMVLLMFSQASLGAYLRHSGKAMACTGFLACQQSFFPEMWTLSIAINYGHRLIALALLTTAATLFAFALWDKELQITPFQGFTLFLLVALQLAVGAAVVSSGFSYPVTALHLAVALLTLRYCLNLWLRQTGQARVVVK